MIQRITQWLGRLLAYILKAVAVLFGLIMIAGWTAPWVESQFGFRLPAGHDAAWIAIALTVLVLEHVARRQVEDAKRRRAEQEAARAFALVEEHFSDRPIRISMTWHMDRPSILFSVVTKEGYDFDFLATGTSRIDSALWAIPHIKAELNALYAQLDDDWEEEAEVVKPPSPTTGWWTTLGVPRTATLEQVMTAWKHLSKLHHPDRYAANRVMAGKSDALMAEINAAKDEARKEIELRASSF